MKFTNLNPPCQKHSMERKCVDWQTSTRTSARGCTVGCVYISTLLTLNSVALGSLRIPGTTLRPPLIVYRDSQRNPFLDLNRNRRREYEKHKSICEPSRWLYSPCFALAQRHISFESVNICVTNMKAEGFQIVSNP